MMSVPGEIEPCHIDSCSGNLPIGLQAIPHLHMLDLLANTCAVLGTWKWIPEIRSALESSVSQGCPFHAMGKVSSQARGATGLC